MLFRSGYSTDNGITWKSPTIPSGLPNGSSSSISKATDGTLLFFIFSTPSKLLKSTDNGVSWQLINATLPTNTKRMFFYGNDIIAHEILGTTYKSTDGGLTFSVANASKLLITISSMLSNGNNIYLYGMSGIYRYGNLKTGFTDLKYDTKLTVFPNPCKDVVTLQSNGSVSSYSITNLQGQLITQNTLPSSNQIDVSSVSKGTYLLSTIEANGQKSTVRLVKQ